MGYTALLSFVFSLSRKDPSQAGPGRAKKISGPFFSGPGRANKKKLRIIKYKVTKYIKAKETMIFEVFF